VVVVVVVVVGVGVGVVWAGWWWGGRVSIDPFLWRIEGAVHSSTRRFGSVLAIQC
jgi:hypothetical protein